MRRIAMIWTSAIGSPDGSSTRPDTTAPFCRCRSRGTARPATCRASPNTSPAVAKKHSSAATRIAVSVVTPRSITIAAIAWKIGNSCG